MSIPVISFRNVKRYYIVGENIIKALDGISLDIPRGSFLAIMGPSGSGKSTLMNLIGCLDTPTSGTIAIDGEELGEMDEDELALIRNRKIGFVFQNFNLLPRLSALDNVMLPLLYRGLGHKERRERAEALLESIILADEPTGALDSKTGGQIMDLFESLNGEGRTIVFVTHDRALGERCAQSVSIRDGRLSDDT